MFNTILKAAKNHNDLKKFEKINKEFSEIHRSLFLRITPFLVRDFNLKDNYEGFREWRQIAEVYQKSVRHIIKLCLENSMPNKAELISDMAIIISLQETSFSPDIKEFIFQASCQLLEISPEFVSEYSDLFNNKAFNKSA